MTIHIIGAGMAGLLAANMLWRHKPVVLEQSKTLPSNHKALLRFRSDEVSKALKIPFKKVEIRKGIWSSGLYYEKASIKMSNEYSAKVTGKVMGRSIMDLNPCYRWIAPPNLIHLMAESVPIIYDSCIRCANDLKDLTPIISTMSMPQLANIMNEDVVNAFESKPIWVITGTIDAPTTDIYQTLYFPNPWELAYRASITGDQITIECIGAPDGDPQGYLQVFLSRFFGIDGLVTEARMVRQAHGKINPIPDADRKQFILDMSDKHNIYSLGRFATWRQIMMDDLIQDINKIESFIVNKSKYNRRLL